MDKPSLEEVLKANGLPTAIELVGKKVIWSDDCVGLIASVQIEDTSMFSSYPNFYLIIATCSFFFSQSIRDSQRREIMRKINPKTLKFYDSIREKIV